MEIPKKKIKKNIVILGAGGHAKVILDILERIYQLKGKKKIIILDDNIPYGTQIGNYYVQGKISQCIEYRADSYFVIAIGDNKTREKIAKLFTLPYISVVHPSAVIGSNVVIGEGTIIMAGAIINSESKIGKHCIINTAATIDHDCTLADFVHMSPGSHIGGSVRIGAKSWVGIGGCIKNNLSISSECVIGAGATVISNIEYSGVYVGVPARRIE